MRESWMIALCVGLFANAVAAQEAREVLVAGQAVIVNGDIGRAREEALQRALGLAAASGSARVNAVAESRADSLTDSTRVTSSLCIKNTRIVGETVSGDLISLDVSVTHDPNVGCTPECEVAYTNKVVVTGIALEFPEQIEYRESIGPTIAYDTAVELARKLKNQNRLLTDHAESHFPYTSPGRAPEPFLTPGDKESPFAILAKSRRAQYVVSGIYRDFSQRRNVVGFPERHMVIDIYVHDGANGALLKHKRFSKVAKGVLPNSVSLKGKFQPGSEAFYATDFGQAWGSLLDSIAQWTSETVACLPFIARVLKIEDGQIFIDIGAEYGVKSGDVLKLHTWKDPPVMSRQGLLLGQEKQLGINLKLKLVYPGFSIVEAAETKFKASFKVRPGDLLYLQ